MKTEKVENHTEDRSWVLDNENKVLPSQNVCAAALIKRASWFNLGRSPTATGPTRFIWSCNASAMLRSGTTATSDHSIAISLLEQINRVGR